MTSTNSFSLMRAVESQLGVMPVAGWQKAGVTGYQAGPQDEYEFDDTITGDRAFEFMLKTKTQVAGNVPFTLAFEMDWVYALAWLRAWQKAGEAQGVNITGITAVDDTIATDNDTVFAEGQIWKLTGVSAANNGRYVAEAGSSTNALVVGAGGTLTDETPGASAQLKRAGQQFAAGDIQAVADGITSTANAFADFPAPVGSQIKIGGPAAQAATRFDTAALNGVVATVIANDDGKLKLTDLPAGWAADAGAGKTIWVMCGDFLTHGDESTAVTETHEFNYGTQVAPVHIQLRALIANTLSIPMPRNSQVRATMGILGFNDDYSGAASGVPLADRRQEPFVVGENTGSVMIDGVARQSGSKMKSATLNIANNITSDGGIEDARDTVYYGGNFTPELDIINQFGDDTDWAKFRAGAQASALIPLIRNNAGYVKRIWAGKYAEGAVGPSARNNIAEFTGKWRCLKDPDTGHVVTVTRFDDFGM